MEAVCANAVGRIARAGNNSGAGGCQDGLRSDRRRHHGRRRHEHDDAMIANTISVPAAMKAPAATARRLRGRKRCDHAQCENNSEEFRHGIPRLTIDRSIFLRRSGEDNRTCGAPRRIRAHQRIKKRGCLSATASFSISLGLVVAPAAMRPAAMVIVASAPNIGTHANADNNGTAADNDSRSCVPAVAIAYATTPGVRMPAGAATRGRVRT
jgi:hypothetical protein